MVEQLPALKEVQDAKAKRAEIKAQAKRQDDGDIDPDEDGNVGKESDKVSGGFPIFPNPEPDDHIADKDDESEASEDADDDDAYTQDALQWDVAKIRERIEVILEHLADAVGDFEKPDEIIEEVDYSIDLLIQLKAKISV